MDGNFRFGHFEFDPVGRELRKRGLRIRVPDQSLAILAALLERPGETVSRERIQGLLWPHGTVVGYERSINAAIRRLREALCDAAEKACFVERVPRQGYRFVAPVELLPRARKSVSPAFAAGLSLLHYRLVERIAIGSMGEVWKAEDTKLCRKVALKFIPERLAENPDALEAFSQEARHAAALNHPNICTIHGLEEHNGLRFLVMEYIDGKPLSDLLRGDAIAVRQILDMGIQAAEALAAAHSGGVIHRDVKPANLILTAGGRLKLTDFGIANTVPDGNPHPGGPRRLSTGTLQYMSPEQARGGPVDSRSDLFSLGVVLYEMATGCLPFQGKTPDASFHALLGREPPSPRALNPAVPGDLERVILKALEKDIAARWQSAPAMLEALRRIDAAVSVPDLSQRDSIVVADFENKTGDDVFDDSLRQALLWQMGQSQCLSVVSEDRIRAAFRSMGRRPDDRLSRPVAREICQRIGAKAVLAGSVGNLGKRYIIGLDLVGSAGGEVLVSEYTEAKSRERVLAAVGRAVSRMRGALGESLGTIPRASALADATTPSLEALKAYTFALHARGVGEDPVPFLEHAVQLDKDFASAHYLLAQVYYMRQEEAAAEEAMSRAFALRERTNEREKLAIECSYHKLVSGDSTRAVASGTLAAQLYPHDPLMWRASLLPLCKAGQYDKALQIARRSLEIAPDDGSSYWDLAILFISFGRAGDAAALLEEAAARGAASEMFPFIRYILAALDGNFAAMELELESSRSKPIHQRLRMLETQTAGFFGQLERARAVARKATRDQLSSAPALLATVALTEAVFGWEAAARSRAKAAARLDRTRRTGATAALALALTKEPALARRIMSDLLRQYPHDSLLNGIWLPAVRAAIALTGGQPHLALETADPAPNVGAGPAWLPYIRGLACLKLGLGTAAAAEFQSVIRQKGSLFTNVFLYGAAYAYPAAQVGLARALAMEGRVEESLKTYVQFLELWTRADSDSPILLKARNEHAALLGSASCAAPFAENNREIKT